MAVTGRADSRELELLERWQAAERGSAAAERVAIAAELAAGAAERVAAGAEVRAGAALKSLRRAHDAYDAYLTEQRRSKGG